MSGHPPLLSIENLSVHFGSGDGLVKAVDGASFHVGRSQTVALVGGSGSGKSITALAVTRLAPQTAVYAAGHVFFQQRDMLTLPERELRRIRGCRIAYIFQEPMVSFNPVFTIGAQIREAILLHRRDSDSRSEVRRLLDLVQLPARLTAAYPHQMSGGQLQRCMIAMALACSPALLIADEPTTALDVTVQRDILHLLADLSRDAALSVLLITHNFGIVSDLADHVYVMEKGRIVEEGATRKVLDHPQHPCTKQLMAAVPRLHAKKYL